MDIRIPFAEAISEPKLLGKRFAELSLPQQVALKVVYGVPLSGDKKDAKGWSELDYWAASQEQGIVDPLGYLTKVTPLVYTPREYREAWGIWGVRSGKTDTFASTIVAYEAVCGGHEQFVRTGRPLICFQIAQDLRMARYSLQGIKTTLDAMAFLRPGSADGWIKNVTADRIELKNGVTIATTPPTVKSIRGYDSPIAVLDEVGVWFQDAESANPDFEIYRNVSSRQAQFPNPKIIGISSPWNKAGLLFQRQEAGTNGSRLKCSECRTDPQRDPLACPSCTALREPHQGRVILYSTTAISNPIIPEAWLRDALNKDPKAFERECLAVAQDSLSGFLPSALIKEATDPGILERAPEALNVYVAAIDPAFRRDAFAFAILHRSGKKLVLDAVRQWVPTPGESLDPKVILQEVATLCGAYKVMSVYTDQYQFESLRSLALDMGISLEPVRFTATKKASIYGNLHQLIHQKRLRLLDHPQTLSELRSLERRLTAGGVVQVSAPEGHHDDLATVVALVSHAAVWLLPEDAEPEPQKEGDHHLLCKAAVEKKLEVLRFTEWD